MQSEGATRADKTVSISSKDAENVQPVLYSFRLVGGGIGSGSVMTAIRPPYWLYHDHALGVIWSLFRKEKNYVGITQLHWCLRFLLDLKNSDGEYTGDVEICIRVIEDNLIEQYAKLGKAIEDSMDRASLGTNRSVKSPPETAARSAVLMENSGEHEEQPDYDEPTYHENGPVSNSTVQDPSDFAMDEQPEPEPDSQPAQRASKMSAILPEDTKSEKSGETSAIKNSGEDCDHSKCGSGSTAAKKKQEAVSFIYNEMISRGPAPCKEGESIANLLEEKGYFDAPHETTKYDKREDRIKIDHADSTSKKMVNFLNSSRQEHIERIKKEIEALYGVERFMENFNGAGFSAYVTEDLARRMESLRNEEVVREAGEIARGN